LPHHTYQRMNVSTLTPNESAYLKVAECLVCAEALDFTEWFTGERKRWKRTEYTLPRLVYKRLLQTEPFGRKLVYALPGTKSHYQGRLRHDLSCTRIILKLSVTGEEVISERYFRQQAFRPVPDGGILFDHSLLLFEFSTAQQFKKKAEMRRKMRAYRRHLSKFEEYFAAEVVVLFIIEAPRYEVKQFVQAGRKQDWAFYFVDFPSFLRVEKCAQLTAPIYISGGDQKEYPLT